MPTPACRHNQIDRSDVQSHPTEMRYRCADCGNYVRFRDKTGWEVVKDAAPVVAATSGVLLLFLSLFKED
jgi:hypothetical protein